MNRKKLKRSLAVTVSGMVFGAFVACSDSDSSSTGPDSKDVEESSCSSLRSSSSSAKSSTSGKATSTSSSSVSSSKTTEVDGIISSEESSSSSAKENAESSTSEDVSSSSSEEISSSSEKVCKPQEYKDGEFQTWIGDECNPRVNTGLDNGSGTSGLWFSFTDDGDGGDSEVEWPVELAAGSLDDMGPVVAFCGGVCGTAVLEKGTLTYQPFLGVGFNVAGEKVGGGASEPADVSAWGGLCVSYKMEDVAATIELGLGDVDATIGYANPNFYLRKSADTTIAVKWSDFKQPFWYKGEVKISGEEAAKQLVAIKFKLQNTPGIYKFNITSVGPLNGECQPTDK